MKIWILGFVLAGIMIYISGCGIEQPSQTTDEPQVVKNIHQAVYEVDKTATDAGEKVVEVLTNAGEATGVTPVMQGVSQVIVDTSEDIAQPKTGTVMGQETTLFPPETENEGKILKIEF